MESWSHLVTSLKILHPARFRLEYLLWHSVCWVLFGRLILFLHSLYFLLVFYYVSHFEYLVRNGVHKRYFFWKHTLALIVHTKKLKKKYQKLITKSLNISKLVGEKSWNYNIYLFNYIFFMIVEKSFSVFGGVPLLPLNKLKLKLFTHSWKIYFVPF